MNISEILNILLSRKIVLITLFLFVKLVSRAMAYLKMFHFHLHFSFCEYLRTLRL